MTTKARINELTPISISQARGVWTATFGAYSVIFADGLTLNADHTFSNVGTDDAAATKKLVARIRKYTDAYMLAFEAGNVPQPGPGDCWMCLMFAKKGMGGSDHLLIRRCWLPRSFVRCVQARARL